MEGLSFNHLRPLGDSLAIIDAYQNCFEDHEPRGVKL